MAFDEIYKAIDIINGITIKEYKDTESFDDVRDSFIEIDALKVFFREYTNIINTKYKTS